MEGIMYYLSVIICLFCVVSNLFAQQDFYKIYLNDEGIYKISGQELFDAGISISQIDPAKIQLFTDGNEILPYSTTESIPQLDEVSIAVIEGGDSVFNLDDYILFYGQPLNRFQLQNQGNEFVYISNPYDTLSCYWMRFNVENGKRIIEKESFPTNPSAVLKDVFIDRIHLEKNKFNPLKSGLTWTWNLFEGYDSFDVNYNLTNVTNSSADIDVQFSKYRFYGNFVNTGQVEIISNGNVIGSYGVNSSANYSTTIPVQENLNLLQFNYIPFSGQDTLPQVGLNWVDLEVERSTVISGNQQKIYIDSSNSVFHINYNSSSNSDSMLIFDISDPLNLSQRITSNDTLFEDTLSNVAKIYYLQKHSIFNQVIALEQSNRNIFSTSDAADYIIICPEDWQSELVPLQTHRNAFNGFVSKIINIEDISDEFGFGRKDPTAIRNFIKFVYDNWSPQPQYILLAGNGYYDYKNITDDFPENWIPPFEIDADLFVLNSRAVNDFYVDLDFIISKSENFKDFYELVSGLWENKDLDNYTDNSEKYIESFQTITPDLAVGRFPADDILQISDLVQKTINYEANFKPGLWRMSSLLISDDENPDGYTFLNQTELLYENLLSDNSRVMKLYETDYSLIGNEKPDATNDLIKYINEGNRITSFIGHAGESQWTHENLLNINRDMLEFRNNDKFPFFLGMGMLYKYDDLEEGILDILIKNQDSGFIGALTADRPVYTYISYILFSEFLSRIIIDGNTIGEALLLSKGGDVNRQKYHLLGDPALSISLPQKKSVQISVTPDTIKAGGLVQISGQIMEPINEDSMIIEIVYPGNKMNINGFEYQQTGNTIFRGNVSLNNNSFSSQFVVPVNSYSDTIQTGGNLYGYLWDNDSESMIIYDSLLFGGIDTSIVDSIPPSIIMSVMKKDTAVNATILKAELYDDSGINLSQFRKFQPLLLIDNNSDTIDVSGFFVYNIGSYQEGEIQFPLPIMEIGSHSAVLIIHDNFGNISIDSLHFIISGTGNPNPKIPTGFEISQNYPNPFNMQTKIAYEISGNDFYDIKIEIYNVLGQKVYEVVRQNLLGGKYEWNWNGTNFHNVEVSSGIYIYRFSAKNLQNKSNNIIKSKKMLLVK
jgi:peptidase C25-like protein